MAQNYTPPEWSGIYLGWFEGFIERDEDNVLSAVVRRYVIDNCNGRPSCLLDLVILWMMVAEDRALETWKQVTVFDLTPTFEQYLMNIIRLIDVFQSDLTKDFFSWPKEVAETWKLLPITTIFPMLTPEERLAIYEDLEVETPPTFRYAPYDHPALRRDTYEHYRARWERAQQRAASSDRDART